MSRTRENVREGACTGLLDVGSRLIYFHKSFRDVLTNQPVEHSCKAHGSHLSWEQ